MLMNRRDLDVPTSGACAALCRQEVHLDCLGSRLESRQGVKSIFQGCRDAVEEFPDEATNRESREAYRRDLEKAGDVLRQMLVANSHHLYFPLDPIDRESFCTRRRSVHCYKIVNQNRPLWSCSQAARERAGRPRNRTLHIGS